MNRAYRDYCRRMGDAMFLRHIFPRAILNDDELIRICQTAQTIDLDVLRQTAEEMFPERFSNGLPQKEQALSMGENDGHEACGNTMVCSY